LETFGGVVKSETDAELVLNSPEDGIVKVKKSDITARERGISSMPEGMGTLLSRRDLRDLIEFLSSLK
jgi:quinoprotein glucose dehydrogenase